MKKALVIWILIAIAVAAALLYGARRTESNQYTSETYGFSFEIPDEYSVHEYVPESIAVGHPNAGGFDALADVNVISSGQDVGFQSFDEFLFESLRNLCAADGPGETIYCDEVLEKAAYTNKKGTSGETYYLNRVHEKFDTGKRLASRLGPIFVFNIQAHMPSMAYATLLVRPSSALGPVEVDENLIRSIAETVQIKKIER